MDYQEIPESHYEYFAEERGDIVNILFPVAIDDYKPPMPNDISIPSLNNFQKNAPDLYRSAFPNTKQLIKMARAGIDIVINFSYIPDLPLPGVPRYLVHIPEFGDYPSYEDVVDFLQIVNYIRQKNQGGVKHKMLAHCIFGRDRTGLMIAAYERVFENKSVEEVEKEYAHFGHLEFAYFEEMLGTPEKVHALGILAQKPPKKKYLEDLPR